MKFDDILDELDESEKYITEEWEGGKKIPVYEAFFVNRPGSEQYAVAIELHLSGVKRITLYNRFQRTGEWRLMYSWRCRPEDIEKGPYVDLFLKMIMTGVEKLDSNLSAEDSMDFMDCMPPRAFVILGERYDVKLDGDVWKMTDKQENTVVSEIKKDECRFDKECMKYVQTGAVGTYIQEKGKKE